MNSLINALIQEGMITEAQLKEAQVRKIGAKKPIQDILVEMGFVKEEDLMNISSKIVNMPISDLEKENIEDPRYYKQ